MESVDLTGLENHAALLRVLFWCVIAFAATWLVTGVIGHLHRRAYNLTHADSGGGGHITPDFLTVDKAKRKAALERGAAYDAVLGARETNTATTIEKVCLWSRVGAMATALVALGATVVGTLTRIQSIQSGIQDIGSWQKFTTLVGQNKVGASVAVAVIVLNIVVFVRTTSKTPAKA